ncbi:MULTISPECIES: Rz1-like lysis system protein LysC [Limnobaculum]|uniref:Rz1-like lysis system protein LysC n=1 Tax=Limnobaculum TaxID=2172100 RepID=UPI003898FAFF
MLLLSGCANAPPKSTPPLPVPTSLFKPCLVPDYQVQHYGDYPGYIAELFAVIEQCNSQISAIEKIEALR